jgi:hypothetical protein
MAFDRIKVLMANLRQRFDPQESEELHRQLDAAHEEITALQALKAKQDAEKSSVAGTDSSWRTPDEPERP